MTTETAALVAASASAIAAFLSVLTSIWAWRTGAKQESLMEDQHDAQVYTFVASILRADDLRTARKCVYEHMENTEAEWPMVEERMARSVAGSFEIAATVTLKSTWARERLMQDWGNQIRKCWLGIEPLLTKWRQQESAPKLFEPFKNLASTVMEKKTAKVNG